MSDTILGGDVTIYYLDENRQKRLRWTGAIGVTYSANALYSALADHFDELAQMDDGFPMKADTPVEYSVGSIDANELDPWYMSYELMEHITNGSVKTIGWTHVDGSAVGIIAVKVDTGGAIVAADYGFDIVGATTGNGTLLEKIVNPYGDSFDYLMIRPDTNGAGDQFTTNSQNITCNGNVDVQDGTVSNTGEQVWANLYSIGTIQADSHIYMYQGPAATATGRKRVYSLFDATQDWWADGHVDVTRHTKDFAHATYLAIDAGFLTVLLRKGNTEYSSFEVATSATSGGRNPMPLGTKADLNNTTGYQSITFTAGSGSWNVGDEIEGDSSEARAIITLIVNPGSTQTLHYFLIDDPLTTFNTAAEGITNNDTAATGTKNSSAPAAQGAALSTWFTSNTLPTVVFGNATFDTDDDATVEFYGMTVDCNQNPLGEVYEWLKYITRRGATGTGDTDGIPGELYEGGTVYLQYSGTVTGTITEGNDVTQETSNATGVIISHDVTNKVILLRNTRGTFSTHATLRTLTDNIAGGTVEINTAAETFAPNVVAPFGSFAGGRFFGARGVLLSDWLAADENNFQLAPIEGGTKSRPQAFSITQTNLVGTDETTLTDDRVTTFRLTGAGGDINKTEMSSNGTGSIGGGSLVVDASIAQDVPGKTTGGVVRIRDFSNNNRGYRLRFSSWTGSTFTLALVTPAALTAGTNTTTLVSTTGELDNVRRGDLVVNVTQGNAVAYVTSVNAGTNTVTIAPAIAGQTSTDTVHINGLPIAMDTLDDVWVPLIDTHALSGTASVSIIYVAPLFYRSRVRNSAATTKILPFGTDGSVASSTDNQSIPTIRTTDTIIV